MVLATGLAVTATAMAQTGPFPAELNVGELDGSNGFAVDGIPTATGLGRAVSNAGDLNGDGVDDFIVARANSAGDGATYVVFGGPGGFPAVIDVEDLDGTNGFRIDGFGPADVLADSVAHAGDVNGDGLDDIIIGSGRAYDSDGRASVVFGRTTGFPAVLALADLTGSDGFTLLGEEGFAYGVGNAVARAGDVNGDGMDDIIVGSNRFYGASRDSGAAYVVFGRTTGFDASMPIEDLDGTNGFAVYGAYYEAHLGRSVASAGDINGDGIGDVIIGSTDGDSPPHYSYTREGAAYVVYGRDTASAGAFPRVISVARLSGYGFEIRGESSYENFGEAVASAGDLNGDGVDDVVIGATPGATCWATPAPPSSSTAAVPASRPSPTCS
jgi:hypothetical protein